MSCSKVSWGYSPSPKVISMHTHILKIWILSNRPGFKFSAIKDSILVQFIIYGLQLKCSRHVKSQRIKTKAKKFHEKTKIQNTTETLYAMIKFLTYICNKSNLMFWWLTFSESSFSVHKKHHMIILFPPDAPLSNAAPETLCAPTDGRDILLVKDTDRWWPPREPLRLRPLICSTA